MRRIARFCMILFVFGQIQMVAQYFENDAVELGIIHQYNNGFLGGGVSFCDFDQDGLDDISFCSRFTNPLFYRNTGSGFENIPSFFSNDKELKQITWVDFDNDGDKDIFTTSLFAPFKLYENNGNMQFFDISVAAGFPSTSNYTFGNCWSDYDRDGDLDVYISNYNGIGYGDPDVTNHLFRNNGDATFTDVTIDAGVTGSNCYTFMSLWLDYNGDLWPDLYSINDRYECRDYLYQNNGDGTFTDVTTLSGAEQYILSMNISAEDYDNDNDYDLYITNGTDGCTFFRNNGNNTFTDVAALNGTELNVFCWGTQFIDGNNDMWQDMYVASTPHGPTTGQDRFLLNMQNGVFGNITNSAGFQYEMGWNRSVAAGDFNQDGYADLLTSATLPSYSSLWVAETGDNHWIKVHLQGVISNRDGISSQIECYAGGIRQTRFTYCGEGYLAQNSSSEIFGLAEYDLVDSIIVRWPSGIIDHWYNIPSEQHLQLVEGTSRKANIHGENQICAGGLFQLNTDDWSHYMWSVGDTTNSISTIIEGYHLVRVTDEFGNQFLSDTIWTSFSPEFLYSITALNPSCFGDSNGSIALETLDWTPILMSINDSIVSDAALEDLAEGQYEIAWTDPANCSHGHTVNIVMPEPLMVNSTITQPVCFGENGAVELMISGGNNSYSVNWGNGSPDNLSPNHYDILISDALNCDTIISFEIIEPSQLSAVITTTDVICNGQSTGSVIIDQLSGGSGSYTIQPDYNMQPLSSGFYTFQLMDELGCERVYSFEIFQPDPIVIELMTTSEIQDISFGQAIANVGGGVSPYQFNWGNGFIDENFINSLTHGDYLLQVLDQNGCLVESEFQVELSIDHVEIEKLSFLVFPNPAQEYLQVQWPEQNTCDDWHIFNSAGELVLCGKRIGIDQRIDIQSLSDGQYQIVIKGNGVDYATPFFIIH